MNQASNEEGGDHSDGDNGEAALYGFQAYAVPACQLRESGPLRGQTLSQWSTSKFDEAAHRDTEETSVTKLSGEAFGSFFQMLDESMPKAARELLVREEIWT